MIIDNNKLIFTDTQASQLFGDDWVETMNDTGGSIFYDGIEFYPTAVMDGIFDRLVLEPVYAETDLEEIYN